MYARVGRQELNYGSQRLISTNDYANNRPRYDGVKLFYRSSDWDVDLFATRPVIFETYEPRLSRDIQPVLLGRVGHVQAEAGDLPRLLLLEPEQHDHPTSRPAKTVSPRATTSSTIGSRLYGRATTTDSWLTLKPRASSGGGPIRTSRPRMADVYFGWNNKNVAYQSDHLGRLRLLERWVRQGQQCTARSTSCSTSVTITPAKLTILRPAEHTGLQLPGVHLPDEVVAGRAAKMHVSWGSRATGDALYNYAGAVERAADPTGKAGNYVGTVLSPRVSNFHLTNRQDIFVTYSHFFQGSYIPGRTAGTKMAADTLSSSTACGGKRGPQTSCRSRSSFATGRR